MYYYQGPHFSVPNFAKFRGTICEIPWHYYPQIPYIPRPVCIVVLTDNTSRYKEFIVTCNTKLLYVRPLAYCFISGKVKRSLKNLALNINVGKNGPFRVFLWQAANSTANGKLRGVA